MRINKVYNIDCLELFRIMKKNKVLVDAIITDPPYNISKENNFRTLGRAGIDFGDWDKSFNQKQWIRSSFKLLKPGGSIIVFNDWKNLGEISLTMKKLGYEIKDVIRWIKPNPMPRNTERRYVTDYEFAIWAVKPGQKWTFNKNESLPYLTPEYKFAPELGSNKRIHPTQKSLKLMIDIFKTHTNEGDIILDPFMGSGTSAVAALKIKRNFIGSEIDPNYFKKLNERLKKYE
ncbi:site-specific DNA-methyltransferase [Mesoplasma florum]|uniref:DNA-methyltransferase n=1 Tax=Mesoplasma florum TaxID=2151 RepID=UPI000D093C5C|nr:site-specific DNA-methyltransferase [Mesoplasma florum]AVN65053.1 site-specific DNA-methyltransferase [Mesoplasma florum]